MRQTIPEQESVISCDDECFLVTSRPGRGKTSVALWFAERQLKDSNLLPSQRILFLTFSRNAVYQISMASGHLLDRSIQPRLYIATYHSFMWWLLQSFGRFTGLPPYLGLIWETKARAVAHGSSCEYQQVPMFLATKVGGVTYDCFAPLCMSLLKSKSIKKALSSLFPVVVVDEFQDTNDEQWELIKLLTENAKLCCFADPDQMIHRFRGASDDRLKQLLTEKRAKHYPLQDRCLRTDEHELLDFAEAILDSVLVSDEKKTSWKKRFLVDYRGPNARSTFLKSTLLRSYSDYKKRNQPGTPSIVLASYSNNALALIRQELLKETGKIKNRYSCKILEADHDESIEDLMIHTAFWIALRSENDLNLSIQIIGSLLAPADITKATKPIQSLFYPEELLSGNLPLKHSAQIVVNTLRDCECNSTSCIDVLSEAVKIIRNLGKSIRQFGNKLDTESFNERINNLLSVASRCSGKDSYEWLNNLKLKLTNERLQRSVLQRIVPIKGRVVTTMHKLKGKEFDYVILLAMPGETFRSGTEESERDARRLLYVGLTRARYDARILYMGSAPPAVLLPFL